MRKTFFSIIPSPIQIENIPTWVLKSKKEKNWGRRFPSKVFFPKREFKTELDSRSSDYKKGSPSFHEPPLPKNFPPPFLPSKIKAGDVPRKLRTCSQLSEQLVLLEAKVSSCLPFSLCSFPFHGLTYHIRPANTKIFHKKMTLYFGPFLLFFWCCPSPSTTDRDRWPCHHWP